MTSRLTPLAPADVAARLKAGRAVLIDIREADEFARAHVKGALPRPLSAFEAAHLQLSPGRDVVFTCRSGMRTGANCDRLAASVEGEAFVMEGGLDGWRQAGLPVEENRSAPLEMMRQVQIVAGCLVLTGVLLGLAIHPAFFGLSAVVGGGLALAGATGFCGMARILALAPWNRRAA
ncbi:MAG: rhodanese-like domain-containing protein [Pseudomonadota bacterium]